MSSLNIQSLLAGAVVADVEEHARDITAAVKASLSPMGYEFRQLADGDVAVMLSASELTKLGRQFTEDRIKAVEPDATHERICEIAGGDEEAGYATHFVVGVLQALSKHGFGVVAVPGRAPSPSPSAER